MRTSEGEKVNMAKRLTWALRLSPYYSNSILGFGSTIETVYI